MYVLLNELASVTGSGAIGNLREADMMKESAKIRRIAGNVIIGALVVQMALLSQAEAQNAAPSNVVPAPQPPVTREAPADSVKNREDVTAPIKQQSMRKSHPAAATPLRTPQPSSATQSTNSTRADVSLSSDGVKYFPSADVHAAFEKGSPLITKDGHTYWVSAGRRDKPGQSELHEKDTDVFYILQGSATFVTGGKMVEPKTTAPGEIRGSAIEGGEIRTLSKDDVIVIPAGVPHWFKDVQGTFLYFVVKVQ